MTDVVITQEVTTDAAVIARGREALRLESDATSTTNWELGNAAVDWKTLGHGLESLAQQLDIDQKRLARCLKVYEEFHAHPLRDRLTFSHYRDAMHWENCLDWLKWAADTQSSVSQMVAAYRQQLETDVTQRTQSTQSTQSTQRTQSTEPSTSVQTEDPVPRGTEDRSEQNETTGAAQARQTQKPGYFDTDRQRAFRTAYGNVVRMVAEWGGMAEHDPPKGMTVADVHEAEAELNGHLEGIIEKWAQLNPDGRWH